MPGRLGSGDALRSSSSAVAGLSCAAARHLPAAREPGAPGREPGGKEGRGVFLTSRSTPASNYCRLQRGESSGEHLRASVPLLPDGDRSAFLLQSSSKEKRPLDRQSRRLRSRTHVAGGQQVLDTDP